MEHILTNMTKSNEVQPLINETGVESLLDPQSIENTKNSIGGFFQYFQTESFRDLMLRIGITFVFFVISYFLITRIVSVLKKTMNKAGLNQLGVVFLSKLAQVTMLIVVVLTCLGMLGINTSSFLALFASLGLAIGLALKDSLANFASGILVVLQKPYEIGNYIRVPKENAEGSVVSINFFTTVLHTLDNKQVFIPNSKMTTEVVMNYTSQGTRRADMSFYLTYDNDISAAIACIKETLAQDERVLENKSCDVVLDAGKPGYVKIDVYPWVDQKQWFVFLTDNRLRILEALKRGGFELVTEIYPVQP